MILGRDGAQWSATGKPRASGDDPPLRDLSDGSGR